MCTRSVGILDYLNCTRAAEKAQQVGWDHTRDGSGRIKSYIYQ